MDRNVIGVLPIYLAAFCNSVTVLNLDIPPELRGVELNEEQIRKHMGELSTYKVTFLG
jgi:hypothetical protein